MKSSPSNSSLKRKIFLLLDPDEGGTIWDKVINTFIICLIILNTAAVLLETLESVYKQYTKEFRAFETFSVIVFSVEYVLRLWTITEKEQFRHPLSGRIKYAFTPGALIDFLPFLRFI